jgi:hypothetical protein
VNRTPSPLCFYYFFKSGLTFMLRLACDRDPPIYASHIAGMSSTCHHGQFLLVEMGSCELVAWGGPLPK